MANMPCGPPKPAKGGGALHVGFAAVTHDAQVRQVVAVVDVQERAVVDRAGIVGAVAAARGQHDIDAQNATLIVKATVVVDAKVVPFAGDHHVVIAVSCAASPHAVAARRVRRYLAPWNFLPVTLTSGPGNFGVP